MLGNVVTHNRREKLGSLLVALALWAFASSGATRTGIFPANISLQLLNVPDGLAASAEVDAVRVRISAEQLVWRQLRPDSFRATLDLAGRAAGVHDVPVRIDPLVPNVQVIEVLPKSVVVQLEPQAVRSVPVEVRSQGDPAEGFFPSEGTTDPASVTVRGAASELERLHGVVAVVDVSGASDLREATVPVQAIDSAGRPLERVALSPARVLARQRLTKLAATKTVGVRVVTTGSPPAGKLLSPVETKPSSVTIAGSEQRLASFVSLSTLPIDVSKFTQRTTTKVALDVPRGVTVADASEIEVSFDVTDQDAVKSVSARYDYANLPSDRRIASVDPATATVVVRGPAAKLATLTATDVVVVLDLVAASVGERRLDLAATNVRLPDGVALHQLVTTAVTVKIE